MTISKIEKINPYDYIRPVVNRDLFAGRREELQTIHEEIQKLTGEVWNSPIIALLGNRRVGKTSILLRIEEMCEEEGLISARIAVTRASKANEWDFWRNIFLVINRSLQKKGVDYFQSGIPIGFPKTDNINYKHYHLQFFKLYENTSFATSIPLPILQDDLRTICETISDKGYNGLIIMLDEAHLLIDAEDIQAQLRQSIESNKCGIVFAGLPSLSPLFTSGEFCEQARVLPIGNYRNIDDVASCAIKPLVKEERMLMSPMTVDYLARLSQGKPNQIRLICSSIYSSFKKKEQEDLNINIRILQNVLEVIASTYTEYDLKSLINKIQVLDNVDLEILYNISRYPDWGIDQIVDLDESFRGEKRSKLAEERRRRILLEKRKKFIEQGILKDIENKCILSGDEFLYLYVRFLYEIRKYGDLKRRLELGKGPPTPFSEKVDKLFRSLCFELERYPRIRIINHINFNVEAREIRERLRRRFKLLDRIQDGRKLEPADISNKDFIEAMAECCQVCELVGDSGPHHFVSILVRNAQNVSELIHVELYFDPARIIKLMSNETKDLLSKQAEQANIWIEDIDEDKIAYLPTLCDLFQILGGPTLEQLMEKFDEIINWRIAAVQHIVLGDKDAGDKEKNDNEEKENNEEKDQDSNADWIRRYNTGDKTGAIAILDEKIDGCTDIKDNPRLARYYNDRGYIKSTLGGKQETIEAENDLKKSIAFFNRNLELTLLDLAVIYIDKEDFLTAISYIEDALFLAVSRENISAGYLKLRLPTHSIAPVGKIEQHPANVIEAAYINLSFSLLNDVKHGQALEAIEEGLALLPNSYRLLHAKARILLFRKQAHLADDIYLELSNRKIYDEIVKREVRTYIERLNRRRHIKTKR